MRTARAIGAIGVVAGLLAATVLSPATAAAPQPTGKVSPAVVSPNPQAEMCQFALSKIELYRNTSAFVAPDALTLLDQTRTVDINAINLYATPFDDDASRRMWYRSMLWLAVAAVDASEKGDTVTADAYAQNIIKAANAYPDPGTADLAGLAKSLELGWDAGTVMRRAQALLCLSAHTGIEPLRAILNAHAAALIDPARYGGPPFRRVSNAGAFANLTLLELARALNDPGIRNVAIARLINDHRTAFSDAGWSNEAAAHYQSVNIRLWREVQEQLRQRGNTAEADALEARLAQATKTAAQLIGPQGQLALIGNTRPTDAVLRPPTTGLPLLFIDEPGGLAIGRWSWSKPKTTWWTAQNRLIKGAHGHEDNTAITWDTARTQVLVDPGQPDYDRITNPYTVWSVSAAAHNRSVLSEESRDRDKVRTLKVKRDGKMDDLTMATTDQGALQNRRVLIDDARHSVEVTDDTTMPQTQYWHLAAGWSLSKNTGTRAILVNPAGKQLVVSSPEGTITAASGSTSPYAGWLTIDFEQVVPGPELRIAGPSHMSTSLTLTSADQEPPAIPEVLRDSEAGSHVVNLRWSDPTAVDPSKGKNGKKDKAKATATTPKATGYRIQSNDGTTGWQTVVTDTGSASTSKKLHKLDNGTAYRFRVATLTRKTVGEYSKPSRSLVPMTVPDAVVDPIGVVAGTKQKPKVNLTWSPPENNGGARIRGYEIKAGKEDPAKVNKPSFTVALEKGRAALTIAAMNRVGTGRALKVVLVLTKSGELKVRT